METLAAQVDIDDPKAKETVANQVLPLIEDVPGSVEREAYRQRLARLLKVDERALVRRSSGGAPARRRTYHQRAEIPGVAAPSMNSSNRQLEETCIKALASDPTLIHYIDRAFREFELACLHPDDFSHTDYKEIFKTATQALEQENEDPLEFIRNRLPDEMLETILENEETYPDWRFQPNAPVLESLLKTFIRLRRVRIDENLDQLVYLQSQEDDISPEINADVGKLALEYIQIRAKLDQALQQSFISNRR